MSNKRRGKSKGNQRAPGVMTDDTFKDSLSELAENLDSLVDGLTEKMSDAPLDLPPPAARAASTPAVAPIAAGSLSLSDDADLMELADRIVGELTQPRGTFRTPEIPKAVVAPEAPKVVVAPEAPKPVAASYEATADDADLDALTDRMIDSIKDGPAAPTLDLLAAPEPPAVARVDSASPARENVVHWSVPSAAEVHAKAPVETVPTAPPAAPPRRAPGRRPEASAPNAAPRATGEAVIPWAAETPSAPPMRSRREPRRLVVAAVFILGALGLTLWLFLSSGDDARAHRQPTVARSTVEHGASKPQAPTVPPPVPTPIEEQLTPVPAPKRPAPAPQEPIKLRVPAAAAPLPQPAASTQKPSAIATPQAPAKATSTSPKPAAPTSIKETPPAVTQAMPPAAQKVPAPASAKQLLPTVAKEAPPAVARETPPASTVTPAPSAKPPVAAPIEPPAPAVSTTAAPPPPKPSATASQPAPPAATYQAPRLLQRETPQYPERLRKQGEGGLVVLKLLVSEQGRPVRVVVEQSLPGSELEGRAIDAALRSVYEPAREGGKPVSAWVVERFLFEP